MGDTERMTVPYPEEEDSPDGATSMQLLAERVDTVAAMFDQGTLAARPIVGVRGQFYLATDQGLSGILYYYNGSAWVPVEPNRPGLRIGPNTNLSVGAGTTVNLPFVTYGETVGRWLGTVTSGGVRLVPGVAGYYSYLLSVAMYTGAGPTWSATLMRKPTGAPVGNSLLGGTQVLGTMPNGGAGNIHGAGTVYLGATDGLEVSIASNIDMTLTLQTDRYPTALWIVQVA